MNFLRYLAVQCAAYAIDIGGFLLLMYYAGSAPLLANLLGKTAAGLFAFVAHRSFTFGIAGEGGAAYQALRYFILLALNLPLSSLALMLMLLLVASPAPAKIVADVACVFITYWLSKKYVFTGRDGNAANPAPAVRSDT